MAVWALETETNFTSFCFPIKEDKEFFHELVTEYFDDSKSVRNIWHELYLLREEPKKHPDFFEIDETDILAISEKAVKTLANFFNRRIELLPVSTDAGKYFALNVLNFIDCLNEK